MYILFDDRGIEKLRYYIEPLPVELKKNEHVEINEKDIPVKEGHITKAKLVNGEIEWFFDKVKKPIDAEEEISQLKEENEMLELALMEMALANEERIEETELAIAELTNLIGEVL